MLVVHMIESAYPCQKGHGDSSKTWLVCLKVIIGFLDRVCLFRILSNREANGS